MLTMTGIFSHSWLLFFSSRQVALVELPGDKNSFQIV